MIKKKEDEIITRPAYNEDPSVEENYLRYWAKFQEYETNRNQYIRFFNKNGIQRNILDYVRDSVDRMNEYHPMPAHKQDWQSNVFDPITRNKLVAILSKIASSRMKPELIAKSKSIFNTASTQERRMIFSDLLENANRHNKDELQLIWEMFVCMSQGTVVGYEGWKKDRRTVEYIKSIDPDTGEVESEFVEVNAWDDVFGEIVPVKEWYPETIWVNSMDGIHRCFRAQIKSLQGFKDAYGGFKNSNKVQAAGYYQIEGQNDWGISNECSESEVFILHFYDEIADKMIIWANGTEIYNGPLPFNHKKLPFWVSIFEPISEQFIYGKSLPDKLMGMQDMDNGLLNAMLDQLIIGLNSPILATGEIEDITDGYLEIGKVYKGEEGAAIQKVNAGTLDPTTFQMLSLIKRGMEETSISAQAQGVASGGRKTKYEAQQLQEGALNLASLFLQIMESNYSQKYWLRMYNIIQYYSQPSSVKEGKPQFKYIVLDNRKLTNGKTGKKMIQIMDSIPDNAKQQLADVATQETGKEFDPLESKVEPIIITADWLMNHELDLEIHIVPNSSIKETATDQINKDITFFQMTSLDPLIDQVENRKDLAKAFGKKEDIVKEPQQEQGNPNDPMAGLPSLGEPKNAQAPIPLL